MSQKPQGQPCQGDKVADAPEIRYSKTGDRVTLEMHRDDFERLLFLAGFAAGASKERSDFWGWIEFANRLNATNPGFQQYEIPSRYSGSGPKEKR